MDGVQPGLEALDTLEARAIRVINGRSALLNAHDKLLAARIWEAARLPHPAMSHVRSPDEALELALPLVIKPRFGSWGYDVVRCETAEDVTATFARIAP